MITIICHKYYEKKENLHISEQIRLALGASQTVINQKNNDRRALRVDSKIYNISRY